MTFIKLTATDGGKPIHINPSHITAFHRLEDDGIEPERTRLVLPNRELYVEDLPEDILDMIDDASAHLGLIHWQAKQRAGCDG